MSTSQITTNMATVTGSGSSLPTIQELTFLLTHVGPSSPAELAAQHHSWETITSGEKHTVRVLMTCRSPTCRQALNMRLVTSTAC